MFNLDGKIALVTGASGGIGQEIAKTLYAQGATVLLTGTREAVLSDLAKSLGERAHPYVCNLSNPESVISLIEKVTSDHGAIDILVNNAGITKDNLFMRMKDEEFDGVLDVNLRAPFVLMRGFLRGMMKKRWGRIINISSVVGVAGNPGQANYCATKAGIIGMGKSLAHEVASRNITVNAIAPGFIESDMTNALTDDQKEKIFTGIPSGRMGSAKEVAYAAAYLSSEESAYMTGQTLHINGGMYMV